MHSMCCSTYKEALYLLAACEQAHCHAQQAAITAEVEAAAAAVEAELDAQEGNMQEIERIQEEQACAAITSSAQPHASRTSDNRLAQCTDCMP